MIRNIWIGKIIKSMRFLTGKRYKLLEESLNDLDNEVLKNFHSFLTEVEYNLRREKRSSKFCLPSR
jgi:hypothetical protein